MGANPAKILVVEDDVSLRHAMILALKKKGFDVIAADRGDTAENRIRSESPDLVVMDVMLPVKSGADLCIELKSDPATQDLPIILITSFTKKSDSGDRMMRELTKADDYISKPIELADLIARIERIFEARRSRSTGAA